MSVTCGGSIRDTCNRATDRCSRLFHCLSDPARRCALSLRAALVALHLVFAGVLFLLDNDLIEKTKQEPWYTATYVFFFVATLVQYFITSVTSPGFVLKAQKDVDERDASYRRSLLATNEANQLPASCSNGSCNHSGWSNYQRNATAWTKLVMDLYPPGTSTRFGLRVFRFVPIRVDPNTKRKKSSQNSLHEQNIVMIVKCVFFNLTITVFGLGLALAKETIVDFGGTYLRKQPCVFGRPICTLHTLSHIYLRHGGWM